MPQRIRDLLARDLNQPIEEVVKVDQRDEATVHSEISEYVVTDRILGQFQQVLREISDGPSAPLEGTGVWISGFFGSGKSSFAKLLGYVLGNQPVLDRPAAERIIDQFQAQAPDHPQVARLVDHIRFINARIPTHVIMFDVQKDRAVRTTTEPIAEIMYAVLRRELDYATDAQVAELEIELEGEGRLAEFVHTCARLFGEVRGHPAPNGVPVSLEGVDEEEYAVWRQVRSGQQRTLRAGAVLHELEPEVYPSAESWFRAQPPEPDLTIRTLVDRTFELARRRLPGRAVAFVMDEVGGYVARSAEKIENLRAVVEHFGQEGRNRVMAGEAPAPVWIVVTSQEKLEEVVTAIDDKRVELPRLMDRFRIHIDMAPADIREVASRRVLTKTPEGERALRALYEEVAGRLRTHTRLEHTSMPQDLDAGAFVQHYPYLPHYIDLSIDIISGLRLQGDSPRHVGGSNRTIIKQAHEMLVGERTNLGDAPVGALVTIDGIYDLVEGNLSSEKRRDIGRILEAWADDPWPGRVAKALALLEPVRDLPRTPANLAALLYARVDAPSPLTEVERALEELAAHQYVRQTENGWKLQTAEEKNWASERRSLSPTPRERHEILQERLTGVFGDAALSRYRYKNLRNFHVGVRWDHRPLTTGGSQIPLELRIAEDQQQLAETRERARDDSRAESHRNDVYWVFCLNEDVDALVTEVHRSRAMVGRYSLQQAQNRLSPELSASLADEKTEQLRLQERLDEQLRTVLRDGSAYFRGVERSGASLGRDLAGIFRALYDAVVPDLYGKLEMGSRPLKGDEAEQVLRAANLNGLPKVFYAPPDGLDLVVPEGSRTVVNVQAPIAREILDYLQREHSYGNKVTGRVLEDHFGGIGYGWEREMLWLVLATLLRAGAIEVTYQGRRFRNHLDPQARTPFGATNAFRSASFAPRKAPDLQTLVSAARRYEALTGEEVDVDEVAIAGAFQRLARGELEELLPVEARARAYDIPVLDTLQEYHDTLDAILNAASDDCVNILAGEGVTFQTLRNRVAIIRKGTDAEGLERLRRMRAAVDDVWPALRREGIDDSVAEAGALLAGRLREGRLFQQTSDVVHALEDLESAYRDLYAERHAVWQRAYAEAQDDIKAQPAWPGVPEALQDDLLRPFVERSEHKLALADGALACAICGVSLAQMASDLAAVDRLRSDVILRVQEITAPDERVERVRLRDVMGMGRSLDSREEVDDLLDRLRDHLLRLLDAGTRIVVE